ncbi:biotin/lipoyl-containing protein [Siansivirga zeaxanthinifaciens]|uniref:Biofilm PGA synthesis protein PgaD n=1 Tax=Siansivirga zeaxanthinifaciens CC-SAMT-1 TaxID=1454006 RepID=A0A0C5W5Z1_9FLAO|nr:biotin/lipoyl-containing protein [Siansivirga zeaxanthinifaciens]AJR02558.1 biofilm PGA synthesis protein PgaD [Siansivirga zeaxanthinifaciens CC-SAMT-1]
MKNFTFKINENSYSVKIVSHESNTIDLEVNGTSYSVKMKEEIKTLKTPTLVRKPSTAAAVEPVKVNPSSSKTKIIAPIPGNILSIHVNVGDKIKTNDLLLVLEAMKMENSIVSEYSGVVSAIHVKVGQQVLQGELMIELE